MKTAFGIFWDDFKALVRNPFALIVVVGLIVLSSVFAWCSIAATWNPLSHADSLKVAVVNNDEGIDPASVQGVDAKALADKLGDDGRLNVGNLLVEALGQDNRVSWQIVNAQQGEEGLRSGEYYAEFIVPDNFSRGFTNVISGSTERPTIDYWVNQKYSASALEATDAGVGVVDSVVKRVFSAVAADALSEVVKNLAGSMLTANAASSSAIKTGLDGATRDAQTAKKLIEQSAASLNQWNTTIESAQGTLDSLKTSVPNLQTSLTNAEKVLADARTSALETESAYASAAAQGGQDLANGLKQVADSVTQVAAEITTKQTDVNAALEKAKKALDESDKLIAALKKVDPTSATVADLEKQNAQLQEQVKALETASKAVAQAAEKAGQDTNALATDVSKTVDSLKGRSNSFDAEVLPAVETSLDSIALLMGSLSGSLSSLGAQVDQAKSLLTQLSGVLQKTKEALESTVTSIDEAAQSISTAHSDLAALANSASVQKITDIANIDTKSYGEFIASPVNAGVSQVYPLGSYGSGMAPFFTSIALWAGCLMLIAALRLEVDPRRFPDVQPVQGYLGRLILLAVLALLQGIVVAVGDLVLGVQAVAPVSFVVACLVSALCFAGVVFALSITFKHVGKALAVVLLVVQIPAASGLYPVQLMPGFLQPLQSWLPFTYSMGAMREGIGGFYGFDYVTDLLWLLVCCAAVTGVALFLRPRVAGVNRLFDRKLNDADVFMAEGCEQDAAASAKASNDTTGPLFGSEVAGESRIMLSRRARSYVQRYGAMRIAVPLLVLGLVVVMGVASALLGLDADGKLVSLMVFIVIAAAIACASVLFDSSYDSMEAKMALAGIDMAGLREGQAKPVRAVRDIDLPVIDPQEAFTPDGLDDPIAPWQDDWYNAVLADEHGADEHDGAERGADERDGAESSTDESNGADARDDAGERDADGEHDGAEEAGSAEEIDGAEGQAHSVKPGEDGEASAVNRDESKDVAEGDADA